MIDKQNLIARGRGRETHRQIERKIGRSRQEVR